MSLDQAHHQALAADIAARIVAAGGAISFAEFMQAALYTPGLGYYMAGARRFGAGGDFITAPELSSLFGSSLAVELGDILQALAEEAGNEAAPGVLELGAGRGRLAADLLAALPPHTPYAILEPSAALQQEQRQYLQSVLEAEQMAEVQWLETLPEGFHGVIVANEVADALPVERLLKRAPGTAPDPWRQLAVGLDEESAATPSFHWLERPVPTVLAAELMRLEETLPAALPPGYRTEVSLQLGPWIAALAASLQRGVILLIDYGYPRQEYYLPERDQGTLQCFYRHQAHDDALSRVGLQDITAHVDFTRVAEAAVVAGLDLLGYASQSAFLRDNDIVLLTETRMLAADNELERLRWARELRTLTLPGEMGERFQVMALGVGFERMLRGFTSEDLSHRL